MKKSNLFEFEDKYFYGNEEEVKQEIETVYGYNAKDVVLQEIKELEKPITLYKAIVQRQDNHIVKLVFRCSKVQMSQAVLVLEKSVKQVLAIL